MQAYGFADVNEEFTKLPANPCHPFARFAARLFARWIIR